LVVRPSLSGPRSAPAELLGGMRRRLGGGSINDASRFSAQVSSEALTGTSERRTRPLRGCQSGIAGDGSARLGATTLDARSPRLAAVEIALCANVLNTRLAAANGVSSPTVAGSSPVHVTARQLVRRGIVDEPAPSCIRDGVLGRLAPAFDLNGKWPCLASHAHSNQGIGKESCDESAADSLIAGPDPLSTSQPSRRPLHAGLYGFVVSPPRSRPCSTACSGWLDATAAG
jgi:hypothetical protein